MTDRAEDPSKRQWDSGNRSGLKVVESGTIDVEYWRDVRPILDRSCVACHTSKDGRRPAARLDLDADAEPVDVVHRGKYPGTYYRLAMDSRARFGHPPLIHNGTWRQSNASRYIRKFQSRRSLLVWKIWGERLDGFSNHDFPTARVPGDPDTLELSGKPVPNTQRDRDRSDLDFRGKAMPPPGAVEEGKVEPLTDEDRRTIVRWIDLGCPIDLDERGPEGVGWLGDDKRPILTMAEPRRGAVPEIDRILVGMFDYYSGLDESSFEVVADFPVGKTAAGENLASRFRRGDDHVWVLELEEPITNLPGGTIRVRVKDRRGNQTEIVRSITVE